LVKRTAGSKSSFPEVTNPELLGRQIVDNYMNNVQIVDGLSRSYGFHYEFFWLPLFVDDLEPIFHLAVEKTAPLIHAIVNDHVHDLTGAYDSSSTLDACHLLPSGTSLVAGKIYEKIEQDMKPAE
jgi:hypothetical protein